MQSLMNVNRFDDAFEAEKSKKPAVVKSADASSLFVYFYCIVRRCFREH